MLTKLLAVVASLASAVIVRDAAEFRAELARGAPSIELADNLYLEGEELNVRDERAKASNSSREAWARRRWLET